MLENFNIRQISKKSDVNCEHIWFPISEFTTPDLEKSLLSGKISCFGKTICILCQSFGEIESIKKVE